MCPHAAGMTDISSSDVTVSTIKKYTSFREDEEALSHIIEFTVSVFIILFIIAGYFNALDSEFIIHTPEDSRREEDCIRYSELLIGDTGSARISAGNTTHWEELAPQDLELNLTRPGFASENRDYGIIAQQKVMGLRNLSYERMKQVLTLRQYNFNIEFTELHGDKIAFFGYDSDRAQKITEIRRIVILENATGDHTIHLIFRLFEGVNRRPLVRINELMYYPEDGKNEWIELYNPTDEAVNLSTLAIYTQTYSYRDHLAGDTLILPGKGYGIVVDDEFTWNQYNFSSSAIRLYVKDDLLSQGGLSNTGTDINLEGAAFESMRYSYNNTMGGDGNGFSIEWSRMDGTWKESLVQGGTPGGENSRP